MMLSIVCYASTSAPIGAWKFNFLPFQEIMTYQPTDRPTDPTTDHQTKRPADRPTEDRQKAEPIHTQINTISEMFYVSYYFHRLDAQQFPYSLTDSLTHFCYPQDVTFLGSLDGGGTYTLHLIFEMISTFLHFLSPHIYLMFMFKIFFSLLISKLDSSQMIVFDL